MLSDTDGSVSNRTNRTLVLLVVAAVVAGSLALGAMAASETGTSESTRAVEAGGGGDAVAGQVEDGGLSGQLNASEARTRLGGDGQDDLAGWSVADAGDVNGDGVSDLIVGAPNNDTALGNQTGAAYIFYGPVAEDDLNLSDADVTLSGVGDLDRAGHSVSTAGDLDGDGYDDVIVGAPQNDANGSNAGAAYVVHGGPWLPGSMPLNEANATLQGSENDRAGWSVDNTTALSDGEPGVLVGAPTDNRSGNDAGAVFLVGGSSMAETVSLRTGSDVQLLGERAVGQAGYSVSSAGDVNDDGVEDVIVGARRHGEYQPQAGAAYLLYGPIDESGTLADANVTLHGEGSFDQAGFSVDSAGDVNNDSVDDVVIGAPYNASTAQRAGAVYAVFGSDDLEGEYNLTDAPVRLAGAGEGDQAGRSVAGADAGGVTCDGVDDILVGAPLNDSAAGNDSGAAYVVAGDDSIAGNRNLTDSRATIVGDSGGDQFGYAVGAVGDQDGDGVQDAIVGAPYQNSSVPTAGVASVFVGDCPTPEPAETEEPTPEPTEEPTPEPTEEPTETESPTPEPTATPTETEEPTETATETEEPTETEAPTETEPATETEEATETPETEEPTETETEGPTETATETETDTAQPLPAPMFAGCSQAVVYSDGSVESFEIELYDPETGEYSQQIVDIEDTDEAFNSGHPVFGSQQDGVSGYSYEQGGALDGGLMVVGVNGYYGSDYDNPYFDEPNCSGGPPTEGV